MTTVAFDGKVMAADSKQTDNWGLLSWSDDKIVVTPTVLIGGAGESAQLRKWRRDFKDHWTANDFIAFGYPTYKKDDDDPVIMLVDRLTKYVYKHSQGVFLPCCRAYHAVGSGRDFALAAMACGKAATEAVEIAIEFDNGSGGTIFSEVA